MYRLPVSRSTTRLPGARQPFAPPGATSPQMSAPATANTAIMTPLTIPTLNRRVGVVGASGSARTSAETTRPTTNWYA